MIWVLRKLAEEVQKMRPKKLSGGPTKDPLSYVGEAVANTDRRTLPELLMSCSERRIESDPGRQVGFQREICSTVLQLSPFLSFSERKSAQLVGMTGKWSHWSSWKRRAKYADMIWEFREGKSKGASPEGNGGELLFETYWYIWSKSRGCREQDCECRQRRKTRKCWGEVVPERLQSQIGALLTGEVKEQKRKIGSDFFFFLFCFGFLFTVLLDENLHLYHI